MDLPMSNYEEERERQIRENALFLASLQIEKPVEVRRVVQKRVRNKENDEDEFKPTREYAIRKRTHRVSYRENSFYDGIEGTRKKKSRSAHKGTRNPNPGVRRVGGRIYDPVNGSTCHQCRQKTTDEKICCTNNGCNIMFDVHCLNVRYEDEADRARAAGTESSWVCPKCTGRCNCSFCRRKQNKRPTGQLTVFIKNNGVDVAKKELSCGGFSSGALYPVPPKRAKRSFAIDNMYISENDDDDDDDGDGDGDGGNSDDNGNNNENGNGNGGGSTRRAVAGRRYSQRRTKASARQRIAAIVTSDDSDFEHLYNGSSGQGSVDRAWKGWGPVPRNIDCIVLI